MRIPIISLMHFNMDFSYVNCTSNDCENLREWVVLVFLAFSTCLTCKYSLWILLFFGLKVHYFVVDIHSNVDQLTGIIQFESTVCPTLEKIY